MDHKPWRWRRKSAEKSIVANGRGSLFLERNFEEDRDSDSGSLKCPSNLSDRLPSVVCDCSAKEELIRKHRRIAEQALAGQEMEKAETAYLKKELEKALQEGELAEKKLANLSAALKDCTREIESLKEQQDERVQLAFSKAKLDSEKERPKLQAKLTEASRRISNMSSENANLMKALICKERHLHDLDKGKAEIESELEVLTGRLDILEEENTLLKYELERVYALEEENATLREVLALSDSELQSWRIKYGQMDSRLAELELQVLELSGSENSMQLAVSGLGVSKYDEDGGSEAWASALLAELEQFRHGKQMDEEECKAIISGTELVPVSADNTAGFRHHSSWLDEILKVILEEHRVSNRDLGELLQDITIALGQNGDHISEPKEESCSEICGFLTLDDSEPKSDIKDGSFTREKIRKHSGFDRSKSDTRLELESSNRHNTLAQMVVNQSTLQDENRRLKEKLQQVTEESKHKIESLQKELESFKESKGLIEEKIENQRLIIEDLNTQLTVAKAKLNENLHKLSSLEVELDHRNNCCDELESTCLELQLQLETVSRKESPNTYIDAVAKHLFEQAICPVTSQKSLNVQGYSLRDLMLDKDYDEKGGLEFVKTEENPSDVKSEKSIVPYTGSTPIPAPNPKVSSPEQVGTLTVVPSKNSAGGFGFIRKMFFRRKKGCTKMKAIALQRNTSVLMRQRGVLLVV